MRRFPHPDLSALRGDWDGPAHCVFEHVYFSRPDSIAFGERSYDVRKRFGAWLAAHDTVRGDVVVPVPDSSNAVALGYAQASGLPFEFGLMRNHYIGRTFISADGKAWVEGGLKGAASATVKTDTETVVGLMNNTVDAAKAFMKGKITADNMGVLMKFATIFRFDGASSASAPPAAVPAKVLRLPTIIPTSPP